MNLKKKNIVLVLILLIVSLGGYLTAHFINSSQGNKKSSQQNQKQEWQTYTNEEFGFKIKFPENWSINESNMEEGPCFNIYPKGVKGDPPFDHFAQVTNVSVYPQGISTEGVFGVTTSTRVSFLEAMEEVKTYLLADNQRWAVYADLRDYSQSSGWNDSGFLWGRVRIENHKRNCFKKGKKVSMKKCDPLMGDKLIHQGKINEERYNTIKEILSSFEFIQKESQLPVKIKNISEGQKIESPLKIKGQARGSWFFEAEFSIKLLDANGELITQTQAVAQDEWTTESFVPFEANLEFKNPSIKEGKLVFQKANPSGLEKNKRSIEIPVEFGWNLYRNKDYNFQVFYPSEWKTEESPKYNRIKFGEEKEVKLSSENQKIMKTGVGINFYKNKEELLGEVESLKKWISKEFRPLKEKESIKVINFGEEGYKGIKVKKFKSVGMTKLITRIFFETKRGVYKIEEEVPSISTQNFPTDYDYKKVFDSMLSNFKLLE